MGDNDRDVFKEEIAKAMDVPEEAAEARLPKFPEKAYVGLAGEVAFRLSEYLESPVQFFYLDYLTFLGALLAVHVSLDTQLREEPRLYIVKVGESWIARKSHSMDEVDRLFRPISDDRLVRVYGVGSAEGLAKRMGSGLPAILLIDEFKALVSKSQGIRGSVLLPMLTTLFSKTVYQNATVHSEINLTNAHLSLVGACTLETFSGMFSPEFRDIGALNRLFLVAGRREKLRPLPMPVPTKVRLDLQTRTRDQIDEAERTKPVIPFTAEGLAKWEEFYYWIAENESPYVARLDTYGLRFLMLFAITTGATTIGVGLVEAVRVLMEYQYTLRKEIDPLDAEGVTARLERAIVRSLIRGRMSDRELRKSCNASRTGLWFYEAALKNLSKRGWVNSRPVGRKLCHWITPEGQEEASE